MNQRACFLALLLSTVSIAALARAPIGGENYGDDASWSMPPFTINLGRLTLAGQKVGYTTADLPGGSSNQDFAALAWARYDPRPATEWTFQIDVSCQISRSHRTSPFSSA